MGTKNSVYKYEAVLSVINSCEFMQSHAKRILVGGCFDLLHIGHITFLRNAKDLGGNLIVLLESDEFIKHSKNKEPFHSQDERAKIIAELRSVDAVIMLPFLTPDERMVKYRQIVELIAPDYIAVTKDDKLLDAKIQHAKSVGAKVVEVANKMQFFSSSNALKYGNMSRD
jgi:FAD synthetase